MNFLFLMATLVIGSLLIWWAAQGNGSMLAWDSWAADIVFLLLGLHLVVIRAVSIFHRLFSA